MLMQMVAAVMRVALAAKAAVAPSCFHVLLLTLMFMLLQVLVLLFVPVGAHVSDEACKQMATILQLRSRRETKRAL